MSARDWRLLRFFQNHMRKFGATPTFGQMRLAMGLKSKQQAKQAFTDLITHLAMREVSKVAL